MTATEDKFTRETITAVWPWSDNLFSLRTTRDPRYRFRAGQFARLGVRKADGDIVWRAYSMVSAPHDDFLEFFSIVVPGGAFTSELSRLREGDELLVEKQPYGYLTLERFGGGRDLWLLATGTGLAPFLSMLQEPDTWERFERIVLVYSVREARDLAYQEVIRGYGEVEHLEGLTDRLVYVPVVTREDHPGALRGRITTLIENGELERAAGVELSPEHSRILICGNPEMVDDTRQLLKTHDLQLALSRRPGQVAVENYW